MELLKLARDVKSTVSAGISFHTLITRSPKKSDLTRDRVDFLYNLYPCSLFTVLFSYTDFGQSSKVGSLCLPMTESISA